MITVSTGKGQVLLRKLRREEHGLTRTLYELCFPEDAREFVDYYYENRADRNEIFAAILPEDGRIISMVHVNPVRVYDLLREERVLPYFVAVATDPAWRRQGLMKQLMEMAMDDCREKGMPFGFLMPANEAYYTPLGFERAWAWRWEEDIFDLPKPGGNFIRKQNGTGRDQASSMDPVQADFEQAASVQAGSAQAGSEQAASSPAISAPAYECSDETLEAVAEEVNHRLAEQFDLFSLRSKDYYRDLQRQQEVSEGQLCLLEREDRSRCMVCMAKEAFPPMMVRVLNEDAYRRLIGRPLAQLRIFISEVV
ncbi:MAG: GNAT family N-acetyltransferase [Lachnospiraceae bacterium]|nr:GNAT family N-acetyltransferase [Lachnospiraceae bacterium]